jgi:hypothetical protein
MRARASERQENHGTMDAYIHSRPGERYGGNGVLLVRRDGMARGWLVQRRGGHVRSGHVGE